MQTKLAAIFAEHAAGTGLNVSAVCRSLGISRKHYYALRRRFLEQGLTEALTGRSRRPASSPGQTPPEVEERIVRERKRLVDAGWDAGARSIRYRLQRDGVSPLPSVSTVHRVLRRHGLVVDAPEKRPRAADRRFTYPQPNACWQIDGTRWALADGTDVCIIKVIDDCSRAVMGLRATLDGENLADTWACLAEAIDRHGVPARVLSDRGRALNGHPQQQSQFRDRVRRTGAQPISSRGYHPQTCGKTERSHQTLQRWLQAQPPAATVTQLQAQLDRFVEVFNTDRPHQAHDGGTPQQIYTSLPKAAPAGVSVDPEPVMLQRRVSSRGEVAIGRYQVQVGRRWTGARVTVLRHDLNVTIIYGQELVRRLVLNPDTRYQGNGRPNPPSSKPHPRRVLPMS